MKFTRRSFSVAAAATPMLLPLLGTGRSALAESVELADAADRINVLIKNVPNTYPENYLNLIWNDYVRQTVAVRTHSDLDIDDVPAGDILLSSVFATGPDFMNYAMMLQDFAGFQYADIVQSVQFGTPPEVGTILQLNPEAESLIPFWESMEYDERENDYGAFWTIGEEAELDLSNPVQRSAMARFNNVAILDDNTIAYATHSQLLQQIQSAAAGDIPGLVEDFANRTAALPADSVNGLFQNADMFMSIALDPVAGESFSESDDAVGPMPVLYSATAGVTEGATRNAEWHNSSAYEFMLLEYDDAEAAAEVIRWRIDNLLSLTNQAPYSEILPDIEIEITDDGMVYCTSPMAAPISRFVQMIYSRDTLPFAFR